MTAPVVTTYSRKPHRVRLEMLATLASAHIGIHGNLETGQLWERIAEGATR